MSKQQEIRLGDSVQAFDSDGTSRTGEVTVIYSETTLRDHVCVRFSSGETKAYRVSDVGETNA